jgi:hypothetical protein
MRREIRNSSDAPAVTKRTAGREKGTSKSFGDIAEASGDDAEMMTPLKRKKVSPKKEPSKIKWEDDSLGGFKGQTAAAFKIEPDRKLGTEKEPVDLEDEDE